jgi:hypothetical protein
VQGYASTFHSRQTYGSSANLPWGIWAHKMASFGGFVQTYASTSVQNYGLSHRWHGARLLGLVPTFYVGTPWDAPRPKATLHVMGRSGSMRSVGTRALAALKHRTEKVKPAKSRLNCTQTKTRGCTVTQSALHFSRFVSGGEHAITAAPAFRLREV